MKKRGDRSMARWGVGFLATCLSVAQGWSDVVFEAGFNGPGNGTGGVYDLVSVGGFGTLLSDSAGRVIVQDRSVDPLATGGGYVECAINPVDTSTLNMMTFTPSSVTNSLDAMTSVVSGDRVLNGGFDFFFRADRNVTGSEMRTLDTDNRSKGGLRFVFTSQSTSALRLEMISNAGGLLTGGEGGTPDSDNNISISGAFVMDSNTVYHLGLTFETDGSGNVTAKLWGQAGAGAIDLTTATPVATLTFGIDENVVTNGFVTGAFGFNQIRLGNMQSLPITQAYDQFRIYNSTPTVFGALANAAVAWRESSPETVLQADFSGEGSGTGSKNDLVKLGGTGALYDYLATVSDAFVTNASPFRTGLATSSGGYLRIVTTNNAVVGLYGRASVAPASAANSLAAMTVVTNGQLVLRGGLDFFFRNERDIATSAEFRVIDTDNRGNGGLRIVLYNSYDTKLRLEVIANSNGLYDGSTAKTSFAYDFAGHIASDTIYHMGISFDSTDDGTVTAAVWQKEGTGAIDLRKDVPIGALTFGINEAVVTEGLTAGNFNFGKLSNLGAVPSAQDFDCLRIYNDTPISFSELPLPARGTTLRVN